MTSPQAILAGAALIALAVIFVNTIAPAQAQRAGGPFALEHHSNTSANAGVFRLDINSGEVSYCFVTNDGSLACSKAVR